MAYIVNGKTYTSNPLMDEIIYNCKLILNGIVVKNEYTAHLYETEETLNDQEYLFKLYNKSYDINTFPFTITLLVDYGYTNEEAEIYIDDRSQIPEEDINSLLEFAYTYELANFEEKNKYYRSLMGLPEYGTDKYNIYITESDLPSDFDISLVDFTVPIHEQTSVVISALKSNGRLDELIEENRSFNYSYLRFLDDKAIDIYKARKATKWEILYMPTVNTLVSSRFREIYDIDRQIYLKRTYQTAYAFKSEYYDHWLIFIVLCQAFTDLIADTPEWFIRKDIFDIRTVQFFLEAYGIPFFEEIPLKYQTKIVKNLNKLIKYKSTDQNFEDIIDIFRLRETSVYRYYLYKKRRIDEQGHYVEDPDLNKMYELLFIEVLLGDTYDNYIKNLNYRTPYDEVTKGDEYWDGVETHEKVKLDILKKEFTIEPTKYLTIKTDIKYIDYQRQLVYLLGMILDTRNNLDDIKISVKSIYEGSEFKLSDLFLYMVLLNNLQFDISQYIRRPEDLKEYTEEYHDYDQQYSDWWLREKYPELFVKKSDYRVFGFNPEVDMEKVNEVITRPYTNFTLRNYTLADFGCENYIVCNEHIDSFDRLLEIYETNIACYESLVNFMNNTAQDKFEVLLANYLFNELFTKRYDYNLTDGLTYLDEALVTRDYILWSSYNRLTTATDKDSRNKDIVAILNDIITNLEYYMDRDTIDYFFSFLSTTSFSAIIRYIYLMVNTFKSYKAHFIEPAIRYQILINDGMAGNGMMMSDTISNRTTYYSKFDTMEMHDLMYRTVIRPFEEHNVARPSLEMLDIFSAFEADPNESYIYDGGGPENVESDYNKFLDGSGPEMLLPYTMTDGGYSYGYHGVRTYDLDGKDISLSTIDSQYPVEIDGGDISDNDTDLQSNDNYFIKQFSHDFNGGSPDVDTYINNNFFKRLYDYQTSQEMFIAARTGVEYFEDKENEQAYLKEVWREWLSILEFEAIKGDPDFMQQLIKEGRFEEYYTQFLQDLEDDKVKVFTNELYEKKNRGINITLSKYPEYTSKIIWIENIGNKDTSRVIDYKI